MSSKYYNSPSYSQATQRVTSRRAKTEQNKLMKQAMIFGVLAVILMVVFGLVIIPGFIRFVGALSSGSTTAVDESIPPQPPLLDAPVSATSSAALALHGFHEKNHTIVVVNDAAEAAKVTTNEDGSFTANVTLKDGENHLAAYAVNDKQKESNLSQEYVVVLDNQPPKLEISQPTDGQSIQGKTNQNLTVKGMSDPKVRITLNDRLVLVHADGSFETTLRLNTGENVLKFTVLDEAGNTTQDELKVTFAE